MSAGDFHLKINRALHANLLQRQAILSAAKSSKKLQAGLKLACKHNLLFFVSLFVFQFNPREKHDGSLGPFIAWDFQDEAFKVLLWCVENDEDVLIEKSRQMGASWMLVILFVWLWLFHDHPALLFISRDEKAVESDKPSSLFWKIDFILKYLPDFLKPSKWKRRKLFFGNDDEGGSIFGEASTGKAGVGATLTAMGIDEFSQIEDDYEVLHRTSDATGCRIFNGTHLGLDTAFYELSQRVDFRKLVLHWSQHPKRRRGLYRYDAATNTVIRLDPAYEYPSDFRFVMDGSPTGGPFPGLRSPWYDHECKRKGSARAIAMDLDIDPKGSVSQFFDPLMIHRLKEDYCVQPYWEGDISFDPDTAIPSGLVKVAGGPLRLWCHLDVEQRPPATAYKFGADLATGVGATNSCLSGVDGATGHKILEYVTPSEKPETFAPRVIALCQWFKDENNEGAQLIWEMQGPGLQFGKRVLEIGYGNIFYRMWEHPYTRAIKQSDNPGFYVTTETKRLLLEDYRAALHQRQFINRSEKAILECLDYKWTKKGTIDHSGLDRDNDPAESAANHGDRVIADALSCKILKPNTLRKKLKEEETKVKIGSLAWRRAIHEARLREKEWA
jgi:hypothetical protein